MQAENRRKPHYPGPESPHGQGAHPVCHSCGWTFPNPHPSAKQRRAHRKHCGKIAGFPLISPHGGDDGGSNGNDDDDDAALGGEMSDAHPYQQTKPMSSLGAVERPAMEEGNVDTSCGMGEGMKTFKSIGFHRDEALVGIDPENTEDSPEATSSPGGDNDLKVPDLLCDKEIRRVDAVNVVEQLETGKQLEGPTTTYTYTSNMKRERLAVELTDDGEGSTSVLTSTSPSDFSVNEMCAEVDQGVLDESSVETEPVAEERSRGGNNLYLESPTTEATEGSDSLNTELNSLNKDNFIEINVLSNLTNTSSKETGAPGTDIATKEVSSESCHIQEMNTNEVGEQELGSAPVLMKVNAADHQGSSPDPVEDGKQNDVFDSDVKEKEDDYTLSACQMPQDVREDNISFINHEVWQCHEQVEFDTLPLPANHEAILKPEDYLGDPDLRGAQSESMLTESRKEDVSKINHKVCEYQGQAEPDILLETVVTEAELKPKGCIIDPGLAEMRSESASVEPSENCVGFLSSGWAHGNSLEFKGKVSENIANKSDENENRTDGINEVQYQSVKEGESGLAMENVQGTEGSASGELIAFPVTMKDQPLGNLIRVNEGPVISSDHVEENMECSPGDEVSFPDLAHQLTSEGMAVEDGNTCGTSNLLTQVKEGKIDSCIAVTADSENDQDDARFHHEALKETITPESAADISDVKSLNYQDLGENEMQRNQEITESVAVTNGGSQPCPPIDMRSESLGFIHLEAWIDYSLCADSNLKEVECGQSLTQIETEARSYITEEKQHSDMDLVKNELEKGPELTHVSPILDSSKSIIHDTSSNVKSMSSMPSLNLHQGSSQNEVHESSTESAGDVDHDSIVAETHIQNKPSEAHNTVSEKPDQEGKLLQNNDMQLSHQFVEIPATEDMVSPTDMLSGIQSSDLVALNRYGGIASGVCLKSDERADVEDDKDDARYPQKVLKETISPESTSDIHVKSLHYQDLGENKVQRNHELTESLAVPCESSRPYPPIDMGSESHGSIHSEAWIDYSACADSNPKEVEGGQSIMQIETEPRSYVTDEQHPNVDFGKNELDKEPELTHVSPTSDTSRSIVDDTFSNLETISSMSHLNLIQAISQNEINESSRESAGDGDLDSVVGETHFQIKPSEIHGTVSEKPDEEKELDQNNEVQLSQPSVEIATTRNMISPPDMLSGIQSSIFLGELNINGKIASSICHPSDKHVDHLTSNQEDTAASSAQDSLMDTVSQMDSTEVHWGSVSALSANDTINSLQDFDTEAPLDVNTRRSGGLHESNLVKRAVSEEQCTEIADLSEAPTSALADGSTQQSSSCTTSNGISPFHTQASCESQERKKKEEIIAKVESWSSGKQHTPLKTLLVEANHESKQKAINAPLHKMPLRSNRSQAPPDEGFTTGNPAPTSDHLAESSAKKEAQKEWNSPARLPANRNDKRKVKGKPQWVPFLCCPSLN